jgi:hypothetical protein
LASLLDGASAAFVRAPPRQSTCALMKPSHPVQPHPRYGNNCICSDHCSTPECYQGDVDATLDYGFDSIKLDGCGAQRDLTLYASLFNATGKSILIENCHWGGTVPNATWCPWNYFRSSGDVRASYSSIVGNLQTTIQWAKSGLSQPGCWAYPDMLEVRRVTRRCVTGLLFSIPLPPLPPSPPIPGRLCSRPRWRRRPWPHRR